MIALLCQGYWRSRPTDEDDLSPDNVFAMPAFGFARRRITSQYSRTYVEQAQEVARVPRLSAAQNEALDMLAAVAEEVCLHSAFEAGDIQLLNNHVIYHRRTACGAASRRGGAAGNRIAHSIGQLMQVKARARLACYLPSDRRCDPGSATGLAGHITPPTCSGSTLPAADRSAAGIFLRGAG